MTYILYSNISTNVLNLLIWAYLHALEDQGHDVAAGDQLFYISSESLRQTAEQIKGHNHEVFIRGLVLVRVLVIHLHQEQKENIRIWGMNQNDTTLWLFILHGPWLERGSSGPGWHSAGKLVHSRAGSHSVVLWPLKTGTKIRKSNKFLKTSVFLSKNITKKIQLFYLQQREQILVFIF